MTRQHLSLILLGLSLIAFTVAFWGSLADWAVVALVATSSILFGISTGIFPRNMQ